MHQKPLVIFDLETTGLSRVKDYIIQFAGIKVNRETNDVIDSLNLYIQPDGPYQISIQAYFKHKIKPDFLKDKPKFSEVAQQIVDFIGDCDLLTYNGNHFDIPFLNHKLLLSGYNVDFINTRNCYDSFIEEKRRNGNTLEETYHRYTKKTMEENGLSAHDAFSDVKATYEVFCQQNLVDEVHPINMLVDDDTIVMQEFNGNIQPCFNIGKYRDIGLSMVCEIDHNYINWCISENCDFSDITKKYIKDYIS